MRHNVLKLSCSLLAIAMLVAACGGSGNGNGGEPDAAADSSSTTDLATGDASSDDTSSDGAASDGAASDDAASDDDSTAVEAAASSSTGSSSTGSDEKNSLEDYLGGATRFVRGGGGGGASRGGLDLDQLAQEQQLIELEIQRCMQQQGFDYTPEEASDGLQLFGAAEAQGVTEAEYAATEGFGITTRFDAVFEGDLDLTDDEPSENDVLLETLSEGEVDAWQFALQGAPPERNEQGQLIDPETGEVIQGRGRGAAGGCELDARVAIRGDFSVLGELDEEFALLDERIDADPRITEIRADWAACMRDLGFAYETIDEARADFQQQVRPLLVSFFSGSGLQAQGGQGRGAQGANLQALADTGLTDEQEAELAAVQDLEIAAAVASLTCAGDTQAEIDEITAGYEAEFVDSNRATLERIGGS